MAWPSPLRSCNEALALELAARASFSLGRDVVAKSYLDAAAATWARAGAWGKVDHLKRRYAHLDLRGVAPAAMSASMSVTTTSDEVLDLRSIVKASQVLSGEIRFEALVTRLMDVMLESAGADRGALLLKRKGKLEVAAIRATNQLVSEQSRTAPQSVLAYVSRTLAVVVVVDDAEEDPRFAGDDYFRGTDVKSFLAPPCSAAAS